LNNLIPTIVRSKNELEQIHQLNKENLRSPGKKEEQKSEGFVSWLYSMELLEKMHAIAPSIIVRDENKIAGYALVALKEMEVFHADLQTMFSHILRLRYLDQPLSQFTFYCMGQICVDKNYRGMGIVNLLYQKHKEIYSSNYRLLVTEISTSNIRSQRAHEKIGFKIIYSYRDNVDEWNVVVWDWR
jgi:ribosomal protein S18 acetylase RimI-like enzyme